MKVSTASVVIGATLIGRMIRKKQVHTLAPSMEAASSISLLMPRKNWRRKKIANGVISSDGSTRPGMVFSRPRFLIRMKLGSEVKIGGTIRAARKRTNTLSRPGQFSREKAYAAREQKNTCPTVTMVE